ncbi:hypothetical protein IWQ57_003005 [Coemansia nantahalensis]|uniref:Uncharacterized protein n=2 Tax=Coemansia TaxID=4863 RepID=A0ACC1KV41_9FUNG|nr:hypothetical protein IWQ57_003005 [Coemansia nantahalensis]KAJ2795510.1 hypothetical protein H4R21_005080 [Coemansia helicoidea]
MAQTDIAEKTAKGLEFKDAGNQRFKDGEFGGAVREYHFALLHLRGLDADPHSVAGPKDPKDKKEEDVTEHEKTLSSILSNMAVCHLRLGKHESTIRCANDALKQNPFNHKAKFRLAQGLIRDGATVKAGKILDELEKILPSDAAFAAERRNIEAMEKKADAKQRKEFAGMFDRASNEAE